MCIGEDNSWFLFGLETVAVKVFFYFFGVWDWGTLRPALLHDRDSASSTTATIKQPTLDTKTSMNTVPNLLYEACKVFFVLFF